MKTKCFAFAVVVLMLTMIAAAQDAPKAEVFGGYQYSRLDTDGLGSDVNANGWNASFTGNLNHWFGVTADVSGSYATVFGVNTKLYTYTGGPVLAARASQSFTPFVHALVGGFHLSADVGGPSISTNGLAVLLGGGVDARLTDNISFRVAQGDWMILRAEGDTAKKNVRISTGVVLRF